MGGKDPCRLFATSGCRSVCEESIKGGMRRQLAHGSLLHDRLELIGGAVMEFLFNVIAYTPPSVFSLGSWTSLPHAYEIYKRNQSSR